YLPGIYTDEHIDEVMDISEQDAKETARALAREEGICAGVSSGGAVFAALQVAKAEPGSVVVAIICDRGDRYLSSGLFS
ncbi:pyridoxal-phosphate dependent enzyme, partial [Streptococcus pyogenes]